MTPAILRLEPCVKRYPWGSRTALAELRGAGSPTSEPEAELWMGTYPLAPSQVHLAGRQVPLTEALPDFELPYLFKVLAVERPLSIQAHPDREQARDGFRREDALGIGREADERSYRDAQAKPELLYALTPFAMLRGFRPAAEILELVAAWRLEAELPECEALRHGPPAAGFERLFRAWMELEPRRLERLLTTLLERCRELGEEAGGVAEWAPRLAAAFPGDRGVLAPLFLNLHRLAAGEAMFTGPGVLHAYLEGVGIELMPSSDNVLRGALTHKHRNVPELARILRFAAQGSGLVGAAAPAAGERRFTLPGAGLELSVLEPVPGRPVAADGPHGAEILLCAEGEARLLAAGEPSLDLRRGDCLLIAASVERYRLEGAARLFRAGVERQEA